MPAVTVVTDQGVEAPGVTIETEPVPMSLPTLETHTRTPSNARPCGFVPRFDATIEGCPLVWVGSIAYRLLALLTVKIFPIATRRSCGVPLKAVHVPRLLPSLARTRSTSRFAEAQISAPSAMQNFGINPTVVSPAMAPLRGIQNCLIAARRLPRFKTPSTE